MSTRRVSSMFKVQRSRFNVQGSGKNAEPRTRNPEPGTWNFERRKSLGLSLVELIVFIVIVSASVAGIIGVITVTTRSSADPMIHKQALAIAEAVLEEVQLLPFTYCDPDDPGAATANAAGAPPAFDAATPGGGTGNPIDVTHTISGTNRYVFVQVVNGQSTWPTINSIVWDPTGVNEALTVIATATRAPDVRTALWGRVNPTAKTGTMRISLSAGDANGTYVAVSSFTGVHQTTPLGTAATATGAVGTTPTVTVTAATGDLIVDAMGTKDTSGNKTAGPGQTERWDSFNGNADGAGSTEAGAASVVMNWTGGVTEEWASVGVALKPGGSCGTLNEAIGPETYASVTETRYSTDRPFDNVNDYNLFDSATAVPSGIRNIDSTLITWLEGYRVTVSVAGQALGAIGNDAFGRPESLLITVTVTGPGNTTVTLNGYRTRYAPNDLP